MARWPLGGWRDSLFGGGLGRRILLWFLVLSLVPLLVSNTVGFQVTRRIIEAQVQRYLSALTEIQAEHVATEVERHHLYLDAIVAGNRYLIGALASASAAVRTNAPSSRLTAEFHEYLDRKLGELPSLTELMVIDTTGTVVAATRHYRVGQNWSTSELVRRTREGRFFAAGLAAEKEDAQPLYQLAVPILDERLSWLGALAGTIGFDKAHMFLRIPPHLATDVHAFITDSIGRPLFLSHVHRPIRYDERLPTPLAGLSPGSRQRYVNYEGVEVFGTSMAIRGVSWLYISEVSVKSAVGQLRGLAILAAMLEGVFALLLVAVVWLVARSIVVPLRRLVGAAEHIRAGELGVEVRIEREDELGQLGRAFNQMSSELRASARQIQELHDQELRRAAQLASVGELASGLAHEIKNPLVGVASGIELLSKRMRGDPEPEAVLSQLRGQVERMDEVIRDFLSYARPKEPRLGWIDPVELADRVITLVGPQADAAGVLIRRNVDAKVPDVRIDPDLFTQALVNLALNGIQAMESGGELGISVRCVDDEIRLSVTDNGHGILPGQLEEIFKPFHTTKHMGTGLGLTITRGIVERHGGRIEVESEPGEGSTFTLVISVEPQEAVATR